MLQALAAERLSVMSVERVCDILEDLLRSRSKGKAPLPDLDAVRAWVNQLFPDAESVPSTQAWEPVETDEKSFAKEFAYGNIHEGRSLAMVPGQSEQCGPQDDQTGAGRTGHFVGWRLPVGKNRTVSALGQRNVHTINAAAFQIIHLQIAAQLSGLDAHNGVGGGIKFRPAAKNLGADFVALDPLAAQSVLHNVLKETPVAQRGNKVAAAEDPLQLGADLALLRSSAVQRGNSARFRRDPFGLHGLKQSAPTSIRYAESAKSTNHRARFALPVEEADAAMGVN
jgi:hypothetical protein